MGIAQGIPDGWMFSASIIAPLWLGNYATRRKAIEAMKILPG